jgi:hypothetical protein
MKAMKGCYARRVLVLAGFVLAAGSLGDVKAAPRRYVVNAIPPVAGFDYFEGRKINTRGEVLGRLDASTGEFKDIPHAGLYRNGVSIDLHQTIPGVAGDGGSLPVDLNNRGQALFRVQDEYWIYDDGGIVPLTSLVRRTGAFATALNDRGDIVGGINEREGFLYRDGKLVPLGRLPHFPICIPTAINNFGVMAGTAQRQLDGSPDFRAVLYGGRRPVDLGMADAYVLGLSDTGHVLANGRLWNGADRVVTLPFSGEAVNIRGEVVGSAGPWPPHARLYAEGVEYDLNECIDPAAGWLLIYAFDINDLGQIVGWGRVNENWSGFILTLEP